MADRCWPYFEKSLMALSVVVAFVTIISINMIPDNPCDIEITRSTPMTSKNLLYWFLMLCIIPATACAVSLVMYRMHRLKGGYAYFLIAIILVFVFIYGFSLVLLSQKVTPKTVNAQLLGYINDTTHWGRWTSMHNLACCGVNGPSDWFNASNTRIPATCCPDLRLLNDGFVELKDCPDFYKNGCLEKCYIKADKTWKAYIGLTIAEFMVNVCLLFCLVSTYIFVDTEPNQAGFDSPTWT